MVITITGVLAGVVSMFIVRPVQAYLGTAARAAMVDTADLALRRIGRDLRIALPNSVRVNGTGYEMELIPSTGAARYATDGSGSLAFGSIDTTFDVVGPGLTVTASQELVFNNLGPSVTDADAYAANSTALAQASSNRRTSTTSAGTATTLTMTSLAGLPVGDYAPPYRVTAVSQPVTYRCDLVAGTLTRYQNYGFVATQPDPPGSGTSAILATGVTACKFSVDGTLVAARAALVNLALTLSSTVNNSTETVSMHHAIFVNNLP